MANTKTSDLVELTYDELSDSDYLMVVDVSDTTMAASGTNKKISIGDIRSAATWVRNESWLAMSTINPADSEIEILHAVFPDSPNWCTTKITVTGGYSVDWGDGSSVENIASATVGYHSYSYADAAATSDVGIADAEACTFTDTGDTVNITGHKFLNGERVAFNSTTTTTGLTAYDIYYVVNATANTFQVSTTVGGSAVALTNDGTGSIYRPKYRQVLISILPQSANHFTTVDFSNAHNAAGISSLMNYCTGFLDMTISAPSATTLKFTNGSGGQAINSLVERVNIISIGALSSLANLFYDFRSLQNVPLFDTSSATTASSMFYGCYKLKTIPLFDLAACTVFSTMFYYCYSLVDVPLLDTSSATTLSNMFYNCASLEEIPHFNTSLVTSFSYMVYNCYNLKKFPALDTSSGTEFGSMFYNCTSLESIPPLDFSNAASGTSLSLTFTGADNLVRVQVLGMAWNVTISYANLTSAALNEIYTNLATVTSKTITVTGCYGVAGDDPTIATAKGWTVTG